MLCGLPFLLVPPANRRAANGLLAALVAMLWLHGSALAQNAGFYEVTNAFYTPESIAAQNMSVTWQREYEPVWVTQAPQAPAAEPLTVIAGQGRLLQASVTPAAREFVVEAGQDARFRANTFYYPGWTLTVDGEPHPITLDGPEGVMAFDLAPGRHTVRLVFGDTPLRRGAAWLSWLAALLLLASLLLQMQKLPLGQLRRRIRSFRALGFRQEPPAYSAR